MFKPTLRFSLTTLLFLLFLTAAACAGDDGDVATKAKAGDPQLAERASDAYQSGDYHTSAELYARCVEADPGNATAWYNYACTLVLAGYPELGLSALENAEAAGFNNARHTSSDPDLEPLREMEKFKQIIARMQESLDKVQADASNIFYYKQQRLGRYQLHLPEGYDLEGGEKLPLLMFLHGRTRIPDDAMDVAELFTAAGFAVILPEAPYPIIHTRGGLEYWPTDRSAAGEVDGERVFYAARELMLNDVSLILQDAKTRVRLDEEKMILSGFSMGATVAWFELLKFPEPWLAAIPVGAGLPRVPEGEPVVDRLKRFGEQGGHLLILKGMQDNPRLAEIADSTARSDGVQDVTLKLYENTAHVLTDEMLDDMLKWAKRTVLAD